MEEELEALVPDPLHFKKAGPPGDLDHHGLRRDTEYQWFSWFYPIPEYKKQHRWIVLI